MNMTADLLDFLANNGVTVSNHGTGAIRLPNGDVAHVWERLTDKGTKITVKHGPKGGRAQSYYQNFTDRTRALNGILTHKR